MDADRVTVSGQKALLLAQRPFRWA